ncbi:MAG: hypothetical protein LC808_02330 [Actinobacteria bacterium]|nr:hypothetical protein [Actinomycetota bacterium]
MTVVGKRTDDDSQCTLLAVQEIRGHWCLYPHGASQLGVRLTAEEAARLGRALVEGCGHG